MEDVRDESPSELLLLGGGNLGIVRREVTAPPRPSARHSDPTRTATSSR